MLKIVYRQGNRARCKEILEAYSLNGKYNGGRFKAQVEIIVKLVIKKKKQFSLEGWLCFNAPKTH